MKNLILTFTVLFAFGLVTASQGRFFGRGGGCANGQCGSHSSGQTSGGDCANGQCSRQVHQSTSEGCEGGSYSTTRTRTKLFGKRRNSSGGSSGDTRSNGSEGSSGGSYTSVRESKSATCTCDCVCPNCGTKFTCPCSGVTSMAPCNCCDKCTGKPGCNCGCSDCTCNRVGKKKYKSTDDELDPSRPPGMKAKPPVEK